MTRKRVLAAVDGAAKAGAYASIAILIAVPILDFLLARIFLAGIPGAARVIQHSLLALAFFASARASCEGLHLSLNGGLASDTPLARGVHAASSFLTGTVDATLLCSAVSLLAYGFEPGDLLYGISIAWFASPMALGLLIMGLGAAFRLARPSFVAACLGILAGLVLGSPALANAFAERGGAMVPVLSALSNASLWFASHAAVPAIIALVVFAFLGVPLYAVLSGVAMILFLSVGSKIELVPSEAYVLLKNDAIPAIPLFTIVGFILSESGAGKRLVAVFRELFGWVPGGEAIATVLVCTFFTTFTGANGVTILALGGILAFILVDSGAYDENFAHGLLTGSSAMGLLFPPSIAVIVYAINATFIVQGADAFDITDMFLGCLIPGLLLVAVMCGGGVLKALRRKSPLRKFDARAALKAVRHAVPELLLPIVIGVLYFTGAANLTEIGSLSILYIALMETLVTRELKLKGLLEAVSKALPVAGGALIIIVAARGLSYFIIDSGLTDAFTAWITATIHSKFMFLLLLNLALLLVGCFMDIFSAILVISPLVIPLGQAFGVHPVHLGAIFITNLSIGFLTPPIGMNLFLASYAFKKPVMRVFRDVLPFFAAQLAVLVLVTYVPWFSLALAHP